MAVLIKASVDRLDGVVSLRFPYDEQTKNVVKGLIGSRWNPDKKIWTIPLSMLPKLCGTLPGVQVTEGSVRRAEIPASISSRLRPYQIEGAEKLIASRGFLLTFEQRVGKSAALIAADTAMMGAGHADACLILYPAGVRSTWENELAKWANVKLHCLESFLPLDDQEMWDLKRTPFLHLGCHYEILAQRGPDLHRILSGRRYIVIADEVQNLQNRKIDRTKTAFALSHGLEAHARWFSKSDLVVDRGPFDVTDPKSGEIYSFPEGVPVASWGATGTPQRNYPRNLWGVMHFASQGCVGSYHKFTERYCDGKNDDMGHWDDSGSSNEDELNSRLAAMSFRKLRVEVAEYLPKADRSVIRCQMRGDDLKKYKKLERHYAVAAREVLVEGREGTTAEKGLKELVAATSAAKIPTAADRARLHTDRKVKVVIAAHFHETLMKLEEYLDAEKLDWDAPAPHFCAGGWKTPVRRREIIDQWRACPGPAILLINSLSSGVGIDLADAEVLISLELEWVPSDYAQLESRIQDLHLGKRKTPPIYEMLLVDHTVDDAMTMAMIKKMKSIEAVVGADSESAGVAGALRGSGIIDSGQFGLPNTNRDTVLAALRSIHERWNEISGEGDAKAGLSGDFEENWDEEEQGAEIETEETF